MILELSQYCETGLHSWDHFLYPIPYKKGQPKIKTLYNYYKKDIDKSYNWFFNTFKEYQLKKKLYFAWPYNERIEIYEILQNKFCKKLGKTIEYYGSERISGWWNYYEK